MSTKEKPKGSKPVPTLKMFGDSAGQSNTNFANKLQRSDTFGRLNNVRSKQPELTEPPPISSLLSSSTSSAASTSAASTGGKLSLSVPATKASGVIKTTPVPAFLSKHMNFTISEQDHEDEQDEEQEEEPEDEDQEVGIGKLDEAAVKGSGKKLRAARAPAPGKSSATITTLPDFQRVYTLKKSDSVNQWRNQRIAAIKTSQSQESFDARSIRHSLGVETINDEDADEGAEEETVEEPESPHIPPTPAPTPTASGSGTTMVEAFLSAQENKKARKKLKARKGSTDKTAPKLRGIPDQVQDLPGHSFAAKIKRSDTMEQIRGKGHLRTAHVPDQTLPAAEPPARPKRISRRDPSHGNLVKLRGKYPPTSASAGSGGQKVIRPAPEQKRPQPKARKPSTMALFEVEEEGEGEEEEDEEEEEEILEQGSRKLNQIQYEDEYENESGWQEETKTQQLIQGLKARQAKRVSELPGHQFAEKLKKSDTMERRKKTLQSKLQDLHQQQEQQEQQQLGRRLSAVGEETGDEEDDEQEDLQQSDEGGEPSPVPVPQPRAGRGKALTQTQHAALLQQQQQQAALQQAALQQAALQQAALQQAALKAQKQREEAQRVAAERQAAIERQAAVEREQRERQLAAAAERERQTAIAAERERQAAVAVAAAQAKAQQAAQARAPLQAGPVQQAPARRSLPAVVPPSTGRGMPISQPVAAQKPRSVPAPSAVLATQAPKATPSFPPGGQTWATSAGRGTTATTSVVSPTSRAQTSGQGGGFLGGYGGGYGVSPYSAVGAATYFTPQYPARTTERKLIPASVPFEEQEEGEMNFSWFDQLRMWDVPETESQRIAEAFDVQGYEEQDISRLDREALLHLGTPIKGAHLTRILDGVKKYRAARARLSK